jgi:hypothetical protein
MMKQLLLWLTCFTAVANAERSDIPKEQLMYTTNKETLLLTADRYITFLNDASSCNASEIAAQVLQLCVPNCQKILNGKVLFDERKYYVDQLVEIKKEVGAWKIQPLDVLTSTENHAVIIRHLVITEKTGNLIVLVILRCNSDGLITEINEVFSNLAN